VKSGQIKAVICPNGAGKTTLFNIISGVLQPDQGSVFFKDRLISGLQPFQIAQTGISRTFQNPSLFLQMSVLENVMVGRHCRSRHGFASCCLRLPGQALEERAIRDTAMCWLDFVGLSHKALSAAGSLAFGQRRMVELARALATEPQLLLLDEPASGLNTKEKGMLGELILKFRESGITILLVEHDMTLVMGISDELLVLHNGTPIAEGSPQAIQNDAKVVSVYLGGEYQDVITNKKSQMRLWQP
jgi:branched-chain amino acid transport system ATP-binding protein